MLPLPTEATTEAMNVSTDRRHPFYTSNDYNRFRQFGFTQQNIVVNIDDEESDTEFLTGKGSLRHWRLGYNLCFSFILIFLWQGNSLILQRKQAYLFLSSFSSPAFTQTNSSLGWEVVQIYVHRWTRIMKPFCHWFIKSLTLRTKCSNYRIIKKEI